jgi:hypothetical protein
LLAEVVYEQGGSRRVVLGPRMGCSQGAPSSNVCTMRLSNRTAEVRRLLSPGESDPDGTPDRRSARPESEGAAPHTAHFPRL